MQSKRRDRHGDTLPLFVYRSAYFVAELPDKQKTYEPFLARIGFVQPMVDIPEDWEPRAESTGLIFVPPPGSRPVPPTKSQVKRLGILWWKHSPQQSNPKNLMNPKERLHSLSVGMPVSNHSSFEQQLPTKNGLFGSVVIITPKRLHVENNSSNDIVSSDIIKDDIKSLLSSFIRFPPSISEKVRRKMFSQKLHLQS